MRRALLVVVCGLLAGCGGERQDADEPSGEFKVEIVRASFPARQHIAEPVQLRVRVRNGSDRTLRTVAVTVETKPRQGSAAPIAFGQAAAGEDLADPGRPVWVLEDGPRGSETAYVNTWLAGTLRAGEARDLTWRLVAVKAGTYTIDYRVAPGLTGKAEPAGGRTSGSFDVTIDDRPVPARVGDDGEIERGGGASN
jgi:hypothetical protein